MKLNHMIVIAGLTLSATTMALATVDDSELPSMQTSSKTQTRIIDIGGHDVPILAGGLYDRYRSNSPLSVIAAESPATDLSWFHTLERTKVDVGFETWSPIFYYENTKVTVIYTANLDRLKELMPDQVLEHVQPLQIWPGRGLVALTAYAYHYADSDSYNEISLAIVTNKPGGTRIGIASLLGQSWSDDFWGYVLKLPVDTELANVRGIVGYNLPKWLTSIHYEANANTIRFEVIDHQTGELDFVLETARLADPSYQPKLVTNNFVNLDRHGTLTHGYAVSRHLRHGNSRNSDDVELTLYDGSFANFMKSLQLGNMVRYEYVPDFQSALYTPKPLSVR
ncbi:hypothetical protein V6U78_06860 [Marinospirillum sp. MEB164]|uniref:Acetoacetate decarboxylase (ADC) n=1 Tax=Marinospirillum alkalitolerans TaxID=3123374 RepID=A0ABW8PWS8_9GAMM